MTNEITYQKLNQQDIYENFLDNFNRYQEIERCWRKENNQWVLKNIAFTENWSKNKKHSVTAELLDCITSDGAVFVAFDENNLIGFASLDSSFFGSRYKYLELKLIQVSYEYRHKGIGKKLFCLAAEAAKKMGAEKIYISAHSSEESQAFYKAMGCVEATEYNMAIAANEPFDCQMEYVI